MLGGAFAAGHLPGRRTEARAPRSSIAVLPFRNLSEDTSYAYVARGLHDELLTQLVKVASLRVVGRGSVGGYAETSKPLRQIGEELAVGSIVEAGVQVDGNRLRVTVQLLDPSTQAHLWAERYDRALDDAFAVQSDIAQRIVAALGARLTSAEGGAIAAPPTQVAGALRVLPAGALLPSAARFSPRESPRRPAALRTCPGARLRLRAGPRRPGFVHVSMHKLRYDLSPSRLDLAQREADVALRLVPGLPQAHLAAAGVLYHRGGKYREALDQVKLGLRGAPNDPELWAWMGVVQLSLGSWDSAVAAFEHAHGLDPRNANTSQFIGDTYHYLRRYPEAIEAYRHTSAFAPDLVQPRLSLGWSYFLWRGQFDTLRRVLRDLPVEVDPGWGGGSLTHQRLTLLLWERRADSVLAVLRSISPAPETNAEAVVTRAFVAAEAYRLRGDSAAARHGFESIATLLAEDRTHPDDPVAHIGRGMSLASLGRRSGTLREVALARAVRGRASGSP